MREGAGIGPVVERRIEASDDGRAVQLWELRCEWICTRNSSALAPAINDWLREHADVEIAACGPMPFDEGVLLWYRQRTRAAGDA